MSEIVSSIATVQLVLASFVIFGVLLFRSSTAMVIGSVALITIASWFLFTSNNLESILLSGTIPEEVISKQPSIEVQRLRIAQSNLIVSLIVGGLGINLLSTSIANYVSKKSTDA